jgi:hypothetical protein
MRSDPKTITAIQPARAGLSRGQTEYQKYEVFAGPLPRFKVQTTSKSGEHLGTISPENPLTKNVIEDARKCWKRQLLNVFEFTLGAGVRPESVPPSRPAAERSYQRDSWKKNVCLVSRRSDLLPC